MALGEHLYAIHCNDNHGNADEHILPYFGTLNHDEVICALIDSGYKGYFTLECGASLRKYDQWTGVRRRFEKESRCREPQLFMQEHIEKMMKETCDWLLASYGILEE
jgi:sugar phosphate isomerase/epimerase